jgi:nitroimidazol reductase NimA-like FMN-containing flavoprotein (pyridoxamine 5'-phosphate oxidase superfamily)
MHTLEITAREEMDDIISRARICYVGVTDADGNPYVFPMNFGYRDGVLYLHSGPDNSSLERLRSCPQICVTFCVGDELVYQDEQMGCSYRMKSKSVICRGEVSFPDSMDAKREALDIIMKHYTDARVRYSDPAVRNVCIWKMNIRSMTAREYAAD